MHTSGKQELYEQIITMFTWALCRGVKAQNNCVCGKSPEEIPGFVLLQFRKLKDPRKNSSPSHVGETVGNSRLTLRGTGGIFIQYKSKF